MRKNKISVNAQELSLQILSHPSYPSLHSVTGVLDHFNIDNLAVELLSTKETLWQLPDVFFAVVTSENQNNYVIVLKKDDLIKISFDGKTYRKIDQGSFLDIWNGVIVVVEAESLIDLETNNNKTKKTLNVLVFCLVFGLLFSSFYSNPSLFGSIYFGLAIIGFSLSLLISKQELGFSSKLADGFCAISSKVNCEAVLSSK